MSRRKINRVCVTVPLILSLMACVWVLGNVAGGARTGGGEGLGFKVFWLLIVAQVPFCLGYLATANWNSLFKLAASVALQVAALALAFAPVAYFKL